MSYLASNSLHLGARVSYREGEYDQGQNGSRESWLPNNRIPTPFTADLSAAYTFGNDLYLAGNVACAAGRDKAGHPELEDIATMNVTAFTRSAPAR